LQFLAIAKGSCGEVRAQLYVALDQNYIDKIQFEKISNKLVGNESFNFGFYEVSSTIRFAGRQIQVTLNI
jgi:hypothetical protein